MYTLVRTPAFERAATRFLRRHPDLRGRLARVLRDLEADPSQAHLKLHALSGRLHGTYAIAITHAYRIVLSLNHGARTITLLGIGSHDDVYR